MPDPLNDNALTVPITQYQYDVYGNHVQITDARGRITRWTYDEFGQQTSRTLPAVDGEPTATETMTYNSRGQMMTHTDFKGQVAKYFYDTDPGYADPWNPNVREGRLTAIEYYVSAGATMPVETVQYRYSEDGKREQVIDSVEGTTDYNYDEEDRLIRVQGPAGLAQTIHYGYDDTTGRQDRMWTNQSEIEYDYDVLGRLSTVTLVKRNGEVLTNPEQTIYSFDSLGQLTSITQKEGTNVVLTSTMTYDTLGRLLLRENKDGSSGLLSSFAYTRLADGNIATVNESVKQPDGTFIVTTANYTYCQESLERFIRRFGERG